MIGKLLERMVNRYYNNDRKFRSVLLVRGEKYGVHVKALGTYVSLMDNLYIAMVRNKEVRDMVLQAAERYKKYGNK